MYGIAEVPCISNLLSQMPYDANTVFLNPEILWSVHPKKTLL